MVAGRAMFGGGGGAVVGGGLWMQTCDGNLGRPFAGAVEDALFDRLHVAGVVFVLHAEHRPACAQLSRMDCRGLWLLLLL